MFGLFGGNNIKKTSKKENLCDIDVVGVYYDNYQKQINFLRKTMNEYVDSAIICKYLQEHDIGIENINTTKLEIIKTEGQQITDGSYLSTFTYKKKIYNILVYINGKEALMSFLSKDDDEKELQENKNNVKITLTQFIRKKEDNLSGLELKKAIISDFNICKQLLLNFNKNFN